MSLCRPHSSGTEQPAEVTANTTAPSKKNITTYDSCFQQHLIDHGIYPEEYEHPNGQE